ncbi:MAG TPA: acyl-CoA dehydratase activase [Bacteroidales bacterium]|nr:acyl-CoA dehydratase activase [Bacteroidales bacterium]HPS16498.1 acyl-CoA dehydratase activase [Bacteroidales bacterium]
MISAGIDIGSRTIKLVVVEDGKIKVVRKSENSFDTIKVFNELLKDVSYDAITSTGYGRHFFGEYFKCEIISEIKAFAIGAKNILPSCKTILDIGGQDTKAILLDEKGKLKKFEMNDKCAAGTGRFLEIMAMALRYKLDEFGDMALTTDETSNVNSMCTVFAESEVVSMLAHGAERTKVARGIHQSVVNRSATLLKRVGIEDDILFAGGVAYNNCMLYLLEQQLQKKIFVPKDPQIIGALGAAMHCNLN